MRLCSATRDIASRRYGGFTIQELFFILVILSVVLSLSIPGFHEWRSRLMYRQVTRNVVSALRTARSLALANNREYRIEFEQTNGRYRITGGNRANDSNSWDQIVQDWKAVPAEVRIGTTASAIQFNPNGTANGGSVRIQNAAYTTKYEVKVARTGRIRMP